MQGSSLDDDVEGVRLVHTPLEPQRARLADSELELGFGWSVRGDHVVESTINQQAYLRLRFDSPQPLEQVFALTAALQNAVTLGVDSPSPITKLSLSHTDLERTSSSGEPRYEPIELMAAMNGADSLEDTNVIHPHEMLFTFEDAGGIAGLSSWLEMAGRFEPVLGALFGHRYMPRMYSENRLQNAVFAAETFDRIRFENRVAPKADFRARLKSIVEAAPEADREWLREQLQHSNEPRLYGRLLRLASHAGESFDELVGDVDRWAKAVRRVRNASVHRDAKRKQTDGTTLYLLSQSIYYLVAICLLRECQVDEEAISTVRDHRRFIWLREQLDQLDQTDDAPTNGAES